MALERQPAPQQLIQRGLIQPAALALIGNLAIVLQTKRRQRAQLVLRGTGHFAGGIHVFDPNQPPPAVLAGL